MIRQRGMAYVIRAKKEKVREKEKHTIGMAEGCSENIVFATASLTSLYSLLYMT